MPRGRRQTTPPMPFYKKLVLNQHLLNRFGVKTFEELSKELKDPKYEQVNSEGTTGFLEKLTATFYDSLLIDEDRLAQYDLNIVRHLEKINEFRSDKIRLKYFQYLSLLFTEHYLDEYFHNREALLAALNEHVESYNAGQAASNQIEPYEMGDLNKISFWNATGSGKTHIMHINYYQYLHYSKKISRPDDCHFILLTPKEGLSLQHLEEFEIAGIPAVAYQKQASRFGRHPDEISVIEVTKLGDKDGDKTVAVSRFGSQNVLFVDEGHRGSSGDTWYKHRNALCKEGFSFEYSATFGQGIKAAGNKELEQEYAKNIIFDYSYRYFYGDGYGKDYNILNLQNDEDDHVHRLYLVACLLTYYQQKKLYLNNSRRFVRFNVENPLMIFVGGSVNAMRTENRRPTSDVVTILRFYEEFVSKADLILPLLERIMSGNTGLLNDVNADIFRGSFIYCTSLGYSTEELYKDMLATVFNCSTPGATMHVENLKGVQGEIRLRVGENEPFGLINVGDDKKLLDFCEECGFLTGNVDFNKSLFNIINEPSSPINVLIGAKKFTEGWNSWRVSTMGLMNIGKSEGSEIIQLFGRGVRLKGCDYSLKRSYFYLQDHPEVKIPEHLPILETLNVFGVKADYMHQFKEYLDNEGVSQHPVIMSMPVIRNQSYKESKIMTLKVRGDLDFKKHGPKPILGGKNNTGVVVLDCYEKVQFKSSQNKRGVVSITKNEGYFSDIHLRGLDYEDIFFELERYKNEKSWHNLNMSRSAIKDLLQDNGWYKLLIPEEDLKLNDFSDYERWTRIAVALMKKYCERYYYVQKKKWEDPLLTYELLNDSDPNFVKEDAYTISFNEDKKDGSSTDETRVFIEGLITELEKAKKKKTFTDIQQTKNGFQAVSFQGSLYNPLIYLDKKLSDITISPVQLNDSEMTFVKDLKSYLKINEDLFDKKELYLIRNMSRKGIGFFEEAGFYPDFIMWVVDGKKQHIVFIEPHGARDMSFDDEKLALHERIKDHETTLGNPNVLLHSLILTLTKHADMTNHRIAKEKWIEKGLLFMEDSDYVKLLFEKVLA